MKKNEEKKDVSIYELIVEYMILFIIVVSCNSVYSSVWGNYFSVKRLSIVLIIVLIPIVIQSVRLNLKIQHIKIVSYVVCYFTFLIIFIEFTKVFDKSTFILIFMLLFPLSVIYLYSRLMENKLFLTMRRLVNVILILAIVSLIAWVTFSLLHLAKGSGVFSNWANVEITNYFWIHFDTQKGAVLGVTSVRNTGIYIEAPMYAFVLLNGLITELFLTDKTRNTVVGILLLTLLSTLSTTGIIFGIIALFLKIFVSYMKRMSPIVAVVVAVTGYFVMKAVSTLLNQKNGSLSGRMRSDDFQAGARAWNLNPIWGNGFGNSDVLVQFMAPWRKGATGLIGYSSGIFSVLNDGGLVLLLLYVFPIIYMVFFLKKNKINLEVLISMVLLIGILIVTIAQYVPLTIFMLAFFYVHCYFHENEVLGK